MKINLGTFISGSGGYARELLFELEPTDPKDWHAGIGTWFIDAPHQSPAWRHYMLSIIHLRDIAGVKPPSIREEGATHEVMILALDPAGKPDPQNQASWVFLSPHNLEEQVTLADDASASKLLGICAQKIVDGTLWAEPALSGQVEPWRSFLRGYSVTDLHMQQLSS